MEKNRNGSAAALISSQKKSYTQELREREVIKNLEDSELTLCICGEKPTRAINNVQDGPATLPCPYYKCTKCNIGTASFAYPEEWDKARDGWESFISNLKDRIK